MIDKATVDRILDTARIVDVIEDFVTLKRRGANYIGLCPFHQDRNPSMYVSPSKGIFKCFACGKAGSALSFVMEHEHLSYPDALRYLAKKYNIEVEESEETDEQKASRLRYESLQIASAYAQKFFEDTLWNTERGRSVGLQYFRERQFSDETIRKFGLGFSPDGRSEFLRNATSAGYKQDVLVDAGLCYVRDNGEVVDRFFDRVMFPIHSLSGKVIAFGGRTLRSDKTLAKYVNSPETDIYHKSNTLYGLFFAKTAISKADRCYMVEGYADVISMHQRGIENVVASSGTALTVEQINLIKRFTSNMTIIYDGDAAGIKAALRGIDLVLEQGMNVKVVLLPPDEDPDSFARTHFKDEVMDYINANEKDFIGFKCQLYADQMASDPLRRSQIINDIIGSVAVIPDPVTRNVYITSVSQEFGLQQDAVFETVKTIRARKLERVTAERAREESRIAADPNVPVQEPVAADITDNSIAPNERELLYYLIRYGFNVLHKVENMVYGAEVAQEPTVASYIHSSLEEDGLHFINPLYRRLYEEYYSVVGPYMRNDLTRDRRDAAGRAVIKHFIDGTDREVARTVIDLIEDVYQLTVKKYQESLVPEEQLLSFSVPKAVLLYKLRRMEMASREATEQLRVAQHNGDTEMQKSLMRRIQILMKVRNSLAKAINRW